MGARGVRNWLIGMIRGDLTISSLDGLRAAGASAYSLAEEADELRAEPSWDPWGQEPSTQLLLVCAWNAFALQAAADHVLAIDAPRGLQKADLVPEASLAFAQLCYRQVTTWVSSARFVKANGTYRLATPLPAALPAWQRFEQARLEHVRGLQKAYEAVAPRAEYELGRLVSAASPEHVRALSEMKLLEAQMHTSLELAGRLRSHAQSHEQLREVRDALVHALGCAFILGQVVAMPTLGGRLELAGYRANPSNVAPLTAVAPGWPVVDRDGVRIATVVRLEGEPALGRVTGLIVSVGTQSADRRVRIDQLQEVERGVVRLAATKAELEPA